MHEKLVSRIMSFVEANIDFEVFTDNIFTVSSIPDTNLAQSSPRASSQFPMSRGIDERDFTKSIAFRKYLTVQVNIQVVK